MCDILFLPATSQLLCDCKYGVARTQKIHCCIVAVTVNLVFSVRKISRSESGVHLYSFLDYINAMLLTDMNLMWMWMTESHKINFCIQLQWKCYRFCGFFIKCYDERAGWRSGGPEPALSCSALEESVRCRARPSGGINTWSHSWFCCDWELFTTSAYNYREHRRKTRTGVSGECNNHISVLVY